MKNLKEAGITPLNFRDIDVLIEFDSYGNRDDNFNFYLDSSQRTCSHFRT